MTFHLCHTAECHTQVQGRDLETRVRQEEALADTGDHSGSFFNQYLEPTLVYSTFPPHLAQSWGTYCRAGVLQGVSRDWSCLAQRGRAGTRAGSMASLHRYIEELKLEEPCEEWVTVLQPPSEETVRGEPTVTPGLRWAP